MISHACFYRDAEFTDGLSRPVAKWLHVQFRDTARGRAARLGQTRVTDRTGGSQWARFKPHQDRKRLLCFSLKSREPRGTSAPASSAEYAAPPAR